MKKLKEYSAWDLVKLAKRNKKRRNHEQELMIAAEWHESYEYARDIIKGRFEIGEPAIANGGVFASLYLRDVISVYLPEKYDEILLKLFNSEKEICFFSYGEDDLHLLNLNLLLKNNINFTLSLNNKVYYLFSESFSDNFNSRLTKLNMGIQIPAGKSNLEIIAELTELGNKHPIIKEKLEIALNEMSLTMYENITDLNI